MDPSIVKIEKDLKSTLLISGTFEEIATKSFNKRKSLKRYAWLLTAFLNFIGLIRSSLVLIKVDFFLKLDYLQVVGIEGIVIHLMWVAYMVTLIIFRTVFLYYESIGKLDFITHFRHLKDQKTVHKMKLDESNLKTFKAMTRIVWIMARILTFGITSTVLVVETLTFYLSCRENCENLTGYIIWYVVAYFGLNFAPTYYTYIFCTYFVAAVYIMMRYDQLNHKVDWTLRVWSVAESRHLMWQFIKEHYEITALVEVYNQPIRWILFCVQFIFQGAAAVGLYVLMSSKNDHQFFRIVMFMMVGQQLMIICGFATIAGFINSKAGQSYSKLCSIRIINGKIYGIHLKHYLDLLIERMASEEKPISFYCYDFFPYTNMSAIEFGISTASIVFLLYSAFEGK